LVEAVPSDLPSLRIEFDPVRLTGRFIRQPPHANSIWDRLRAKVIADGVQTAITDNVIEAPWAHILSLIREYGSRSQQQQLGFRFRPEGEALNLLRKFAEEVRATSLARSSTPQFEGDIDERLRELGFTRRSLKPFQLRDLQQLVRLPHGANFSVPGAGKTTVTFALHLLVQKPDQALLVIGPKSAFAAWREVVDQCLASPEADQSSEQFCVLEGTTHDIDRLLRSGARRFLMTYESAVRQAELIASYLSRKPFHLVLDEAHRMKAGLASQRGAFLLNVASLPVRRDILTGTPMPQGPNDLAAQLGFLWPGQGLDLQISRGQSPRSVCEHLYVRTTKNELGIPPAKRHFIQVGMAPGHLALYAVVRREAMSQLARVTSSSVAGQIDFVGARRSVMRLLQLSSNPILALQAMTSDVVGLNSGIADQVLAEGPSLKMRAVEDHVRRLAAEGKKALVWTIFTDSLHELERMLADLNPVSLYGDVPSGPEDDPNCREGRIKRFHDDPSCQVLIANPAAAGEGISLHRVCHDAIYLDRSYVSTHYLQSIDRIHRLGLPPDTETNISIYQTKAPVGLGSIDFSVSRRLRTKIRGLQELLNDPDLHEVALDEEMADDPIDYSVDLQDLVDLVAELEGTARAADQDEF
jgi:hypothetical protein